MKPITKQAHEILTTETRGSLAIDATAGNGHDTLFLAQLVGPTGTVWAFDLQPEALRNTATKLAEHQIASQLLLNAGDTPDRQSDSARVYLIQADHAEMTRHLPIEIRGKVSVVMFNLGYLPGSDKRCVTTPTSTLKALDAAWTTLAPGGVLSVVVYPGHPGGREEAEAVRGWTQQIIQSGGISLRPDETGPHHTGPQLLALRRDH